MDNILNEEIAGMIKDKTTEMMYYYIEESLKLFVVLGDEDAINSIEEQSDMHDITNIADVAIAAVRGSYVSILDSLGIILEDNFRIDHAHALLSAIGGLNSISDPTIIIERFKYTDDTAWNLYNGLSDFITIDESEYYNIVNTVKEDTVILLEKWMTTNINSNLVDVDELTETYNKNITLSEMRKNGIAIPSLAVLIFNINMDIKNFKLLKISLDEYSENEILGICICLIMNSQDRIRNDIQIFTEELLPLIPEFYKKQILNSFILNSNKTVKDK